jgi:gliding motility-associated-like protein
VEATTNNITCPGLNDGVAVINVISGGSGSGNYYVSLDTGATFIPFLGPDITSILDQGQGSYLFIAIDSVTGCMDTTVANIGVSTDLMAVIDVDDPGCDLNDGKISFNVSGGIDPFEVDLIYSDGFTENQNGGGFFQFRDLLEGRYFYEIREQSGCVITPTDSIELITNCPGGCVTLTASAHSFEDATCATTPDGKAIIDVSGGVSPYEYSLDGTSWLPFISGNIINQLPGDGSYNVIVRQDSLNPTCRVEVGVTINGPAPIVLEDPIMTVDQANCNVNDGSVKIGKVSGGTTPYDYQLDGEFITMPSDSIITDLMAGLHQFSVIDDLGCRADFPFSVTSPGAVIADAEEVPVSCADIALRAGIRVTIDLITTDVSGPYEAVVIASDAPDDSLVYSIPDSGIRTIYGFNKGFYEVIVRTVSGLGCSYTEVISLQNGVFPVDFDILSYDSIVGCSGDFGSVTIGNVIGDVDTTFYVHLVNTSDLILDTYELRYPELENGFTIDETNSENLLSGTYYIRVIQNQDGCPLIEATSSVFSIYEPSADLGFEVIDDDQSFPDQPSGFIEGQVIPSGGDPYEALIQLLEPSVPLSIAEVVAFNDSRDWEEVQLSGELSGLYLIRFDELWPGRYEIRVVDDYGCEISIEHEIDRDSAIFIPNVFTPNDDGYNDVFYIRNLPESGTEMLITNRLGRTVFQTSNYTFDNLWDGGTESDGIYFYKIKMSNGDSYSGWIELWRGSRP